MVKMLQRFLEHVMPNVVRPLQALWNQLIGFLFLVLAAMFATPAVKALHHYKGDADSVLRLTVSLSLTALMAYFGISSLLRARRISRS